MVSEKQVISIIAKALMIEESSISLSSKSSDFPEWDSLGQLSILNQISEEMGDKYLDNQDLASSICVQEIFDCLNKVK